MTNLSQEQEEMRQSIQKSAMIWSIIFGVIIAGIAYWSLGGQGAMVRMGASAGAGIVVLFGVFKWRFGANSKSSQCEKCSAAFSISKTNHVETLKSSESKETRDAQEDGSTKVTTWTEEVYDVVDTYTCASCNDEKTKEYTTTRKVDEKAVDEPAPKKASSSKSGGSRSRASASKAEPEAEKTAPSRTRARAGSNQADGVVSSSKSGSAKATPDQTDGVVSTSKSGGSPDGNSDKK
ncbi:MAG: hypothetical protein JKY31_08470 [Rhodobacteraceae bacterium]|nr:hypothetical protein [Paracoccaceae bacterium]